MSSPGRQRTIYRIPEDDNSKVIMCARYSDEHVGANVCNSHSYNNCADCPIHLEKQARGLSDERLTIVCQYGGREDDSPNKHVHPIFRGILNLFGGTKS